MKRARRGKRFVERLSTDTVVLRYAGLDGIDRTTTLHFSPAPAQLDRSSAEFVLDLGPGQGCRLALRAGCGDRGSEDLTIAPAMATTNGNLPIRTFRIANRGHAPKRTSRHSR